MSFEIPIFKILLFTLVFGVLSRLIFRINTRKSQYVCFGVVLGKMMVFGLLFSFFKLSKINKEIESGRVLTVSGKVADIDENPAKYFFSLGGTRFKIIDYDLNRSHLVRVNQNVTESFVDIGGRASWSGSAGVM